MNTVPSFSKKNNTKKPHASYLTDFANQNINSFVGAIDQANQILAYASTQLQKTNVPFDSRLGGMNATISVSATVSSRITKKFHLKEGGQTLHETAIINFKDYERQLADRMITYSISDSPHLFTVRRRLLALLKDFTIDFDQDVDVGPGESYISSSGYTQLIAKLDEIDHWTTTADCWDDTCNLIYYNRTFKRMAKVHMGFVSSTERRSLYAKYRNHPHPGFAVFSELLARILRTVPGSKGTSVPKNNETNRFINIEATFPMILQRYVAHALKKCLSQHGYGLGDGHWHENQCNDRQEIHKLMIALNKYATVDFSNASDSVCLNVILSLFPAKVASWLTKFRSRSVLLDDQEFELFKLSSMGNGFTFEVMTCLLLACCLVFTTDCSVYGDDVIIPNEHAKEFVKLTRLIGFNTNNKKTFINSPFRESCGAFYRDGIGYITSFDFTFCETYNDVIISHNKIKLILDAHSNHLQEDTLRILTDTFNLLSGLATASRCGPFPPRHATRIKNMGLYFFSDKALKKHKNNSSLRENWRMCVDKCKTIVDDYMIDPRDYLCVNISVFVPRRSQKKRHRIAIEATRLRSKLIVQETVRGKGRWTEPLAFVDLNTGEVVRVKRLLLQQKLNRRHTNTLAQATSGVV